MIKKDVVNVDKPEFVMDTQEVIVHYHKLMSQKASSDMGILKAFGSMLI